MSKEKEFKKFLDIGSRAINDRERLKYALQKTLISMGLSTEQCEHVIKEVRVCNFAPLDRVLHRNQQTRMQRIGS